MWKTVIKCFFVLGCLVSIGASIAELFVVKSHRRAFDREIAVLQRDIDDVVGAKTGPSSESVAALSARLGQLEQSKERLEPSTTALAGVALTGSVLMLLSGVAIALGGRRRPPRRGP